MTARGALGRAVLVAASLAVTLTAADVFIRLSGVDFRAMRSRANDDSFLETTEFRTHVVTNGLGFREARLPGPKPAGTMRIVVLGDSFTQGYGVEEDEAYPRQLERLLDAREPRRRHEVINLGVPGACPLDYVEHMEQVGVAYEPDLVVVGFMANDVRDIRALRARGHRILPSVLREVQAQVDDTRPVWKRLPSRLWPTLYRYAGDRLRVLLRGSDAHAAEPAPASAPDRTVPDGRWKDVLLGVAARYDRAVEVEAALPSTPPETLEAIRPVLTGQYQFGDDEDQLPMLQLMALINPRTHAEMVLVEDGDEPAWREAEVSLARIAGLARRAGARTMIVYVPAGYQVTVASRRVLEKAGFDMDPRTLTDTSMLDHLRRIGADLGVPVVDVLTPLRARADEALYFPVDGHWTPLGHRVAAEVLAAAIVP